MARTMTKTKVKVITGSMTLNEDIVKVIEKIVGDDEVVLKIKNNQGIIEGTDRSMICYFRYEFEANSNKEVKIGIRPSHFSKALKSFDYSEIKFEIKNEKIKVFRDNKCYIFPLYDIVEEEIPEINKLEWDIKTEIDARELKDIIKNTEWFADKLKFKLENGNLTIEAVDYEDLLKYQYKTNIGLNIEKLEVGFPFDKLKVLANLTKNKYIPETITIHLKKDYPIKIEKDGFTLIVAPRIEEEYEIQEPDESFEKVEPKGDETN